MEQKFIIRYDLKNGKKEVELNCKGKKKKDNEHQIFFVATINRIEIPIYTGYRVCKDNLIKTKLLDKSCISRVVNNTTNNAGYSAKEINNYLIKMEIASKTVFETYYKHRTEWFNATDRSEFKAFLKQVMGEEQSIKKVSRSKREDITQEVIALTSMEKPKVEFIELSKYTTVSNLDLQNKSIVFWYYKYIYDRKPEVSVNRFNHYKADLRRLLIYIKDGEVEEKELKDLDKVKYEEYSELTFENFDIIKYYRYLSEDEEADREHNTLISIMKRLKAFYTHCRLVFEVISVSPFEKIKFGEEFGNEMYDEPITNTKEELEHLFKFDFKNKIHRFIADRFILQSCLGCRIGDFDKLTYDNIEGDKLVYFPKKVQDKKSKLVRVEVPLSKRALEIIEKYREQDDTGRIIPYIKRQDYNKILREVFKAAGLTREVLRYNVNNEKQYTVKLDKEASSHLARRNFVDILYQQGVPIHVIASMSGHAPNSKAFDRYKRRPENLQRQAIEMFMS